MVKKRSSRNYSNNDGLEGYLDLDVEIESVSGIKPTNDGFLTNAGPRQVNTPAEEKTDSPTTTGSGTAKKKQKVVDLSQPNPLFNYASYNVLFTLSGLTQGELEDTRSLLTTPPHDIICRSSGIGPTEQTGSPLTSTNSKTVNSAGNERLKGALEKSQATLAKNRDIYFKNVNMTAIPGPNDKRRLTGVTTIKMELVEPAGISLLEKIRGAAINNNYLDHMDAPYLLTMNFAGFDEMGNTISDKVKGTLDRRIPVKLVDMDMSVTGAGTVYTITAIPMNEASYVNRYNYPRTTGKLSLTKNKTLAGVVHELEKVLNKQNQDEADAGLVQFPDTYEITINEKLRPNVPITYESLDQAGMTTTVEAGGPAGSGGSTDYMKFSGGNPITKMLEEIMKGHPDFTDDKFEEFKKKNTGDQTPVESTPAHDFDDAPTESFYYDYFRIKGSVINTTLFDEIRNMNVKKIIYTVEPYKVHAMSLAVPGTSTGQNFKAFVRRKYNYIFTGKNKDILDLDIRYKVAYFQSRLKDIEPSESKKINVNDPSGVATGGSDSKGLGSDGNMYVRSYPGATKSGTAGKSGGTAPVLDAFLDALTHPTADMVVIRMTILGDPAYLGQSQFMPATPRKTKDGTHTDKIMDEIHGAPDKVWNSKLNCFNSDLAEPVVLLNFRMPTDIDDNAGVYEMRSDQSAEFSGLYRVTQVEHDFDGGNYTNVLTMIRFNNQGIEISNPQTSIALDNKLITRAEFKDIAKSVSEGLIDNLTNTVKRKFKDELSRILKN